MAQRAVVERRPAAHQDSQTPQRRAAFGRRKATTWESTTLREADDDGTLLTWTVETLMPPLKGTMIDVHSPRQWA
jgi:hypothetical protein